MHWTKAITSRPHWRLLEYLAEPEHWEFGPPYIEHIAAELGTDHRSAWNLLKPLVEGGMVVMEPGPYGGSLFSAEWVLGEVG